jgi:hypothetical protein
MHAHKGIGMTDYECTLHGKGEVQPIGWMKYLKRMNGKGIGIHACMHTKVKGMTDYECTLHGKGGPKKGMPILHS